ncbi:MAG: hypothetical protein L3J98_16960 [Gammaproteobacteria bacterium]|nr:hypothetical protein [Gammaproteobacteria bacterium]MCF6261816.1 hypothetical protein [Gammaproteobacteria bacterium]
MSCRRLIVVLLILLYPSTLLAEKTLTQYTTEERELEQAKFRVMEELAEAGVSSAYTVLAEMGEDRPLINPASLDQLVYWYTSSAQSGNSNALLWLGHYFLHGKGDTGGREYDALLLLASASILGSLKAANDLVLIPKIIGVSYPQLEEVFHDAMQRLSKGQVIDCRWIKCNPRLLRQADLFGGKASRKAEIFRDNWKRSNTTSAYQYLKSLGTEKLLAQSTHAVSLNEITSMKNTKTLKKNERLVKEKRLAENLDWEMQTYLDRLSSRRSSAQDALKHYKDRDFARLEKDTRRTIDLINFHRDPDAQINYEDVLQQMKKDL